MKFEDYLSKKITPKVKEEVKELIDKGFAPERIYEDILLKNTNPKIKQKIDILRVNPTFRKDTRALRKKWGVLLKNLNFLEHEMDRLLMKAEVNKNKDGFTLSPPEGIDKTKINKIGKEFNEVFMNKDFDQDAINLAEKNKLSPIKYWKEIIKLYILENFLAPIDYLFKTGLIGQVPNNEVFKASKNLNFAPKLEKNEETGELELFIQIFENTTTRDIKSNWKMVNDYQKEFRKTKNTKRSYSLKNIEIANKIINRKKKIIKYYEPTTDKQVKIKETDSTLATEIYGDMSEKEEKKAKNKIKQIRYQHRKKLNL